MAHEHIDFSQKVIEMQNIVKKFGDFTANDGINLTVHKGEIHAILGENGAGKSTLMNQLYGMFLPTSAQILVNGKPMILDSPKKAIEAGIGMVHQHFMLVQPFTVTENIALGMEPVKGLALDMATARKNVVELSEKYNLAIDPDAKIEDISVGMQQRVEILKALYRGAEGRNVEFKVDKPAMQPGEVVLDVQDLHGVDYRGVEILKGLSLQVRKGEILGIAGIDGNGQSEMVEIITGLRKATGGKVSVNGVDVTNKPPRFGFDNGVSSIPEDRQKHGLVLDFSVADNMILQNYADEPYAKNRTFLNRKAIEEHARESMEKYDIRPRDAVQKPARTLSGGNQQKAIIAREVNIDKDLLIAVNPTRGLDVGAIEYVHRYIVEQRNKGKAVLLVSFELDEIMSLSDRIDVIFDGSINGSMLGSEADENKLGLMMAGGKAE